MQNQEVYDLQKEKRLEELRSKSYTAEDATDRYRINDSLYLAYAFYKFDKALQ